MRILKVSSVLYLFRRSANSFRLMNECFGLQGLLIDIWWVRN